MAAAWLLWLLRLLWLHCGLGLWLLGLRLGCGCCGCCGLAWAVAAWGREPTHPLAAAAAAREIFAW